MWDPSSLTRDQTHVPFNGRWILNHWTIREIPLSFFFVIIMLWWKSLHLYLYLYFGLFSYSFFLNQQAKWHNQRLHDSPKAPSKDQKVGVAQFLEISTSSPRCFLRPTWLHTPGCLALGEWSHHCGYLGHEDLFCTVLPCILATSSWYLLFPLGPYHFCP